MLHEVHFISKEVGRSGVAKRHRSQIMSVRVHSRVANVVADHDDLLTQ